MRPTQLRWAVAFLTPYTIGAVFFIVGPMALVLYMSFTNWTLFGPGNYVGASNFFRILSDPLFFTALQNTLYYTILVVPGETVLALFLAMFLNRKLRGIGVFRAIFFMPFVLSLVAVGLLWSWLYSPNFGFIDQALQGLGLPGIGWLSEPSLAMPSVALTSLWRNTGYYSVIFLAALQAVPQELYDAAKVDGAGRLRLFLSITLPFLSPTIFFVVVIATIWAFQIFDLTYIMTQGGPVHATLTNVLYIYQTAFADGKFGYAAAQSWVMLVIVLALTAIYFIAQRKWVFYA